MALIRDGAPPDVLPPSGPTDGWHVVVVRKAPLGRPPAQTDMERQLSVGAYSVGEDGGPLIMLLDELPRERIVVSGDGERPPHRLAFYLPGSKVVLTLELVADS